MVVSLPQYRWSHERALGELLGLEVSIGGIASPRPGVMLYTSVDIFDPETHQKLAHVRLVETWRESGLVTLRASQPELNEPGFHALWKWLTEDLRKQAPGAPRIHLDADELLLKLPGIVQTIHELRARLEASEAGPQAKLTFRLPGAEMPRPAELTISRNRRTKPPLFRVDLTTSDSALPAGLLSPAWPAIERLGSRATLRGSFWAEHSAGGWRGEASGDLEEIDLASLVNEQFPHHLSGTATLRLTAAHFDQGRLAMASGSLAAGPGAISRSLVSGAESSLHCVSPFAASKNFGKQPSYEKLALEFVIDGRGLAIQGCEGANRTVLFDGAGNALLQEPAEQLQPVTNLVRLLVPQSEVLVPASQETNQLTQFLPVPAVILKRGTVPEARNLRLPASAKSDE